MVKIINMLELRKKIGEVLDRTYYNKDYFLIRRNRRDMAVVIPIEDYLLFYSDRDIEVYTDEQIKEFMENDKISPALQKKIDKITRESP